MATNTDKKKEIIKGLFGTLLLPIAGRRKLTELALKGLGAFGDVVNTVATAGASTDFGQTSPFTFSTSKERKNIAKGREKVRLKAKHEIEDKSVYLSPSSHAVAWTQGSLDPRVGALKIAEWGPEALLLSAATDIATFAKGPKAIKATGKATKKAVVNTAAKAGIKPAKAAVIAREINKGVNKNTPKYDNRIHSIRVDNLIYNYSSNPLLELVNTIKTSPTNSYFMRAPSKIDITKLHNGRFRHEVVGNNVLPSGEVNGKFVSYGEPWKEFGFSEGSTLYEFPIGPKRGPNMMATDWKGRSKDYSVNEAYDYMKLEELLKRDLRLLNEQMGKLFNKNYATIRNNLIESKYPLLKEHIDTSIYGGNQTVIPNLKWNFDNFLNSPFYKYTIDPISNQVQKELIISGVPNKPVETSTSLAFFERKPSKISEAERAGIPKGERNFKPKWHVANYPGYLLKGLMRGSLLEKQLSKTGTININQLNAYFNKASQLEKAIANKVLTEKFAGLKTINYNLFKKAVLDELIGKYNRVPLTEWANYGLERLGLRERDIPKGRSMSEIIDNYKDSQAFKDKWEPRNINGKTYYIDRTENTIFDEYTVVKWIQDNLAPPQTTLNTFTFESPRIPYGNTKHYGGNPIGHSRTYTLSDDPHTLYVMESQSDWALQVRKSGIDVQSAYERASLTAARRLQEVELMKANLEKGLAPDGHKIQYEWELRNIEEIIKNTEKLLSSSNARAARFDAILHPEKYVLENYLKLNYLQRLLQENLRYAAENGLTKMRYPTSETVAKIEGYTAKLLWYSPSGEKLDMSKIEFNPRTGNFEYPEGSIMKNEYPTEHQTILKKYSDFPKLFRKLFKDLDVRVVTDAKGNTWYEVDVPKGYLSREWLFKKGGRMKKHQGFVNGVNVLDSNPTIYKKIKRKMKINKIRNHD